MDRFVVFQSIGGGVLGPNSTKLLPANTRNGATLAAIDEITNQN